jgi:hypothetical protein
MVTPPVTDGVVDKGCNQDSPRGYFEIVYAAESVRSNLDAPMWDMRKHHAAYQLAPWLTATGRGATMMQLNRWPNFLPLPRKAERVGVRGLTEVILPHPNPLPEGEGT